MSGSGCAPPSEPGSALHKEPSVLLQGMHVRLCIFIYLPLTSDYHKLWLPPTSVGAYIHQRTSTNSDPVRVCVRACVRVLVPVLRQTAIRQSLSWPPASLSQTLFLRHSQAQGRQLSSSPPYPPPPPHHHQAVALVCSAKPFSVVPLQSLLWSQLSLR